MIDFHAHILPGADHGSDGLKTSLCQLELAEAAHVNTIVATPHFYPQSDSFSEFLHRRERTASELANHYHGPIRILLGAEVHMCVGLDHLPGIKELCVSGTSVILSELTFRGYAGNMGETFDRMQDDGLIPILAHVDRYDPDIIESYFSQGVQGQVNADALIHRFGRRHLLNWIDDGWVIALGSDIHMTEKGYGPYLKARGILGDRAGRLDRETAKLLKDAKALTNGETQKGEGSWISSR